MLGLDLLSTVLFTLFIAFFGLGVHNAFSRVLSLVDGHLERLQAKLDVLIAAQVENNEKLDVVLQKLL